MPETYSHHLLYIQQTNEPTYVRTYVRTYVHTYVRSYVRTYVRTYVCTYVSLGMALNSPCWRSPPCIAFWPAERAQNGPVGGYQGWVSGAVLGLQELKSPVGVGAGGRMRCGSSLAVFPGWLPGSPEGWKLLGLASVSRSGNFLYSSGQWHDRGLFVSLLPHMRTSGPGGRRYRVGG